LVVVDRGSIITGSETIFIMCSTFSCSLVHISHFKQAFRIARRPS
jgi:hypothetical protein